MKKILNVLKRLFFKKEVFAKYPKFLKVKAQNIKNMLQNVK